MLTYNNETYYTAQDIANILGYADEKTVRKSLQTGSLKELGFNKIIIKRKIYVRKSDFDNYMSNNK
jgi:prophage antirepressor-like protein